MVEIIEKEVLNYLTNKIDGIGENVFVTVPVDALDEYIVIERTGGDKTNYVCTATIAVQSYSKKSMLRAIEINEAVKSAMDLMPYYADVFSCRLNSDYNYTDTDTKYYRYQAVFNIAY